MTNYPRDEFDRVPEFSNRYGAHRADGWAASAAASGESGLRWLMITGAAALVVGLLSFFVLPGLLGSKGPEATPPAASPSATPTNPKKPAVEKDKPEPSATKSSNASAKPEATDEPSATPGAFGPLVNTNAPIGVYNASNRGGLAGTGSSTLKDSGFTQVSVGDWTKKATVSAVYYRNASSRQTAEAAAESLGITTVVQTANIPGEIAVVLGNDFNQ